MANTPPRREMPGRRKGVHWSHGGRVASSTERGYGSDWQAVRNSVVNKHPLCIDCRRRDVTRPVDEVHHVEKIRDRPDLRLDRTNLAPLCEECHEQWEDNGPPEWWPQWVAADQST